MRRCFVVVIQSGWLGLGGAILHDVAGASSLSTTEIYGSVAYHQMIGYSSLLSIGFNTGWVNNADQTIQI